MPTILAKSILSLIYGWLDIALSKSDEKSSLFDRKCHYNIKKILLTLPSYHFSDATRDF